MHQFSANYLIPGITTAKGKPSGVDANWIPHSLEEIKGQLGFPGTNPEIPEDDTEEVLRIYRRGWQERTDSLIEYLQQSRDGGQG
jgi:hypothetical protein